MNASGPVPQLPSRMPDASESFLARLAEALTPVAIPDGQRARMRQRIRNEIAASQPPTGTLTWRSFADGWVDGLPGIRLKFLRVDATAGTQEVLVRFLPGGSVPAHSHTREEQMVIIDGTVFVGSHRLAAGDVHVASAGTSHAALTSPDGALLLLRCEHPFPVDR